MAERTEVHVQHTFPVSADTLFAVIGDFTNLSWVPAVYKTEFEGEGPGMVRRMTIDENSPTTVEVLDTLDPANRTISYSIPENNPLPVEDYRATMSVTELGPDSCRLDWRCSFLRGDMSEDEAQALIHGFYGMLLPGLEEVVSA